MRKMPPLNALKAFEAAGRHQNFRRAAEELDVSQGAVAQHVRHLENLYGTKLFDRQPRGVTLTDVGKRFLPVISHAFDQISMATEDLAPQEVTATISSTPSFATRWLVPRLGALASAHPDVRLRLDASNGLANFQSDGVDVAIRLGTPPFGAGLEALPLFPSALIAVCHPALAIGDPPISTPDDLCQHVLLEDSHGLWPLFLEAAQVELQGENRRRMEFSQTALAIDSALAGQGVALTVRAFVEADLAAGRLCQPVGFELQTAQGFYLVAPRKPRNRAVVALLKDWILAQI